MTKNLNITVYLVALGAFSLGMASYVTAGLIPMIKSDFSVSLSMAAQLVTAFTVAYGLGSPIVVALLPTQKTRSGLLLALALFVLANGASAIATSFEWLLAFRAFAGIGAGVYLAMGIAASTSIVRQEQRGKSISVIMGGMASGTVLGVPLSLLLAEHLGWSAAMWLVTLLGAIAFVGLTAKLPSLPKGETISLRNKLSLLKDGRVVLILVVSLLAAVASLGMYTFISPLIHEQSGNHAGSVTPYLWVWGIGGVVGSFLVGPLADRIKGPQLTLWIVIILAVSLSLLPIAAPLNASLILLPIALWGASGWALQVPQNNELIKARETKGDGNLAVALNESALYLGSAIGAALGGILLLQHWPVWLLASAAGAVAVSALIIQIYIIVVTPSRVR